VHVLVFINYCGNVISKLLYFGFPDLVTLKHVAVLYIFIRILVVLCAFVSYCNYITGRSCVCM